MAGVRVPRRRLRGFTRFVAERTAFAPGAVAVEVMLLFPDRGLVLHRLDRQAAGAESLVAMRGAGSHHHREVADAKLAGGVRNVELQGCAHFGTHTRANCSKHLERQRFQHIVADAGDRALAVLAAHPSDETRDAAETRIAHELQRRQRVEARHARLHHGDLQIIHVQPPLTGGNTASSPPSGTALWLCRISPVLAKADMRTSPAPIAGACARRCACKSSRSMATLQPAGSSSS